MKRIKAGIVLMIIVIFLIKEKLLIPYLKLILFFFNAIIIFFKSKIKQIIICSVITFAIITLIVLIFKKIPEKPVIKKIKQLIEFFQQFF